MASILFTNSFFVYCVRKKQTAKKCVLAKSRMKKKTMEWWINRMYTPLHLSEDHPWHGHRPWGAPGWSWCHRPWGLPGWSWCHRPWGAPGWSWCHRRRLDSTVLNQENKHYTGAINSKFLQVVFFDVQGSWSILLLQAFIEKLSVSMCLFVYLFKIPGEDDESYFQVYQEDCWVSPVDQDILTEDRWVSQVDQDIFELLSYRPKT